MTTLNEEFSNKFDILYNNIMSNQAPGLDNYEKSVLLTKAQEDVVKGLYNGNLTRESFENSEELRRSLDSLIVTDSPIVTTGIGLSHKDTSYFYTLKDDVMFITYESADLDLGENNPCGKIKTVIVTPVTQDDFDRIAKNPFRQANSRRVLRLDAGKNKVELISKYKIDSYLIRYLKRPTPIILEDLDNGLFINGENTEKECLLNPILHDLIIDRAVSIAKLSMESR